MTIAKLRLITLALFAAHLGVMLYVSPPSVILGPTPLISMDWSTHYEQCKRAVEAFTASGRTWLWDPHLLAGQLSGAIFDADNKGFELWCIALGKLGVPFDRAYNLFAWLGSALLFPVVLASARLLGASRGGAVAGAALASLLWWFDAFHHWLVYVGMISWAMAAYLYLLPLGLFVSYLRDRRPWMVMALAPALALTHTVHPYAFFVLAPPMLALYVRERRALSRRDHAAILGAAAFTVVANLWWLKVAIRFWHYILDSGYYLDATPGFIVWDLLGVTRDPWVTGVIANRTAFRVLVVVLAGFGLVQLRKRRDERFLAVATALGVAFFVAYFGGITPLLRQVQPYRFVSPALMLSAIVAGVVLVEAWPPLVELVRRRSVAGAAVVTLAIVAAPRLLRDVMYFVPELVPRHKKALPLPPPNVSGRSELGGLPWEHGLSFRHAPPLPHELALIEATRRLDDGSGRFLVEWWASGEQLAGMTNAQVLGGFREINLAHSDANFFRVQPEDAPIDPEAFRAYLEAFNVKYIALVKRWPAIEQRTDLLEPLPGAPGAKWFRVKAPSGWIASGGPGTVRASNDRIEVRGSRGGSLTLRYHFLETLKCTAPGCTVRRVESPKTRVGFIGVDGAPPDFDVVNAP